MEKALEKIKEIIDFCDAVGCHRAIYESIKFVEKELEEASLNRREWYQKGYNEAMKPKTCKGCAYDDGIFCAVACSRRFKHDAYTPKDTQC